MIKSSPWEALFHVEPRTIYQDLWRGQVKWFYFPINGDGRPREPIPKESRHRMNDQTALDELGPLCKIAKDGLSPLNLFKRSKSGFAFFLHRFYTRRHCNVTEMMVRIGWPPPPCGLTRTYIDVHLPQHYPIYWGLSRSMYFKDTMQLNSGW